MKIYNDKTYDEIKKTEEKINALKLCLSRTDYKAIKYGEGEITAGEYAETLAQRRKWRAEINALETQLKALKG